MNILLLVRDQQDKEHAMKTFAKIYGKEKCKFIDVGEAAMCLDALFGKLEDPNIPLIIQIIRSINDRVNSYAYDDNILLHDIPDVVSEFKHAFNMFFGHIYDVHDHTKQITH